MTLIICLIGLLITISLATYCVGKALDIKFKDDYTFVKHTGNGFGDTSWEDTIYAPIIKAVENSSDEKKESSDKHFQYTSLGAFIVFPFVITVKILLTIGKVFHLSYTAVNIIVWYMLFPLAWAAILDYKLHRLILSPMWLLLCIGIIALQRKQFNQFCDTLFKLSQVFIASFGNYYKWSVIICLLVPFLITVILLIA